MPTNSDFTAFFLINPLSGGRRGARIARQLQDLIARDKIRGEVALLSPGTMKWSIEKAGSYDCLVVAGGDGSISSALAAMDSNPLPVAFIPLGTANDLGRELGVRCPKSDADFISYFEALQRGSTREFQLWKLLYGPSLKHRVTFSNYVSFGFEGSVVSTFSKWRSESPLISQWGGRAGNRLGYLWAGMQSLNVTIPSEGLTIHREHEKITLTTPALRNILFVNIASYLGLGKSCATSTGFDDRIEALASSSLFDYGSIFASWLPFSRATVLGTAKEWSISGLPADVALQIDGEAGIDLWSEEYKVSKAHTANLLLTV